MKTYRVRYVEEFLVEADSKVEAMTKWLSLISDPVASEIRIRSEDE